VTFITADNMIREIIIDTTETSRNYFKEIKEKSGEFTNWLKEKYPDETSTLLHETEGLFLKRLKEYVETS
jgi:hydroxymethylglutaryl-CoA reductase